MKRPPESLKSFANRVGSIAVSDDASEAVRLLHLAGFFDGSAKQHIGSSDQQFTEPIPDQVGIWARKTENGKSYFVRRPETRPEWLDWANLGRIEAKGKKPRVVLIGESVARGYFYDPQYTPAHALRTMLESQFDEGVEVIDLARTNLHCEVRALAIEALQLEPDVAIVFAGNNWWPYDPIASELAEVVEALSTGGVAAAKRTTQAQIRRNATRLVNDICRAYQSKGIPLVWIIPEFNLVDWRDHVTNAPYFSPGLNRQWVTLQVDAQAALRAGDFDRAERLARQMVEIDQGVCTAGLYILADCRRAAGDFDEARRYFEMAKDASSWDLSRGAIPKPFSATQQAMREELPKYKNQVIDLPVFFKDYLNGGLPDRRLFIDYCHLSSEGIQITMAAAAACVLRVLKGVEVPWPSLIGEHTAPSSETEAKALFLAAIMNAHRSPSREVVRHFCAKALSYSPHIVSLMQTYIDLQNRSVIPMLMSDSDAQIHKLGSPLDHQYILRLNEKRLDAMLLDVIVEVLADVGVDAREQLDLVQREEHSVVLRDTNLLDHYYCTSANQPQEVAWKALEEKRHRPDERYYKAYGPESRFVFVGEADCPVRLCLTCRLPASTAPQSPIFIEVNGKHLAEIVIGYDWTTWDITIDRETVRDGINEVTVGWPIPEIDCDEALRKAVLNVYEGKFADLYPIFGEIHSFIASNGMKVQTTSETVELDLVQVEV